MTYCKDGVIFNGQNYLTSSITGSKFTSSTKFVFSAWVRIDGGDNEEMTLFRVQQGIYAKFSVLKTAHNNFRVVARDSTNAYNLAVQTTSAYAPDDAWIHILVGWDSSQPSGPRFYINNITKMTATPSDGYNYIARNIAIDYGLSNDKTQIYIGGNNTDQGYWKGAIAELYFETGTAINFASEPNRRKFTTAADSGGYHYPISLGTTYASTPSGLPAPLFLSLTHDAAASTFATNLGNGIPTFSLVGPPLVRAMTRPTAAGDSADPDATVSTGGDSGGDGADGQGANSLDDTYHGLGGPGDLL